MTTFYIRSKNDFFSIPYPTREQAQAELTKMESMLPWMKGSWDIVDNFTTHSSEREERNRKINERARELEREIRGAVKQ